MNPGKATETFSQVCLLGTKTNQPSHAVWGRQPTAYQSAMPWGNLPRIHHSFSPATLIWRVHASGAQTSICSQPHSLDHGKLKFSATGWAWMMSYLEKVHGKERAGNKEKRGWSTPAALQSTHRVILGLLAPASLRWHSAVLIQNN